MRLTVAMAILLSGVFSVNAAEPTVSLKLVAKQKNYAWPVEQTPEDFDAWMKAQGIRIVPAKPATPPPPEEKKG